MKRLFDIVFAVIGLVLLLPLFIVVAALIKLDSKGPVFFRQERMGKDYHVFRIYKFRTMICNAEKHGPAITVSSDQRITALGHVLRDYKIDELPQLINVLKGEMSFVGPRPEVRKYVEMFKSDYTVILTIRPGITDPATLQFSDEQQVLLASKDCEETYIKEILPGKLKLSLQYVQKHSLATDIRLIVKTIFVSFLHTRRSSEHIVTAEV